MTKLDLASASRRSGLRESASSLRARGPATASGQDRYRARTALWHSKRRDRGHGHRGPVHLFHGAVHRAGLYLTQELTRLAEQHPHVEYAPAVLHEHGPIDQVVLGRFPKACGMARVRVRRSGPGAEAEDEAVPLGHGFTRHLCGRVRARRHLTDELTVHADYALRVLIYLGSHPGTPVATHEISTAYGISKHHLVRVVQTLERHGYVDVQAGRSGGVLLARDPDRSASAR